MFTPTFKQLQEYVVWRLPDYINDPKSCVSHTIRSSLLHNSDNLPPVKHGSSLSLSATACLFSVDGHLSCETYRDGGMLLHTCLKTFCSYKVLGLDPRAVCTMGKSPTAVLPVQDRLPFSEASADKAGMVALPCILSAGSLSAKKRGVPTLAWPATYKPQVHPGAPAEGHFSQISWDFRMTFLLLPPRFSRRYSDCSSWSGRVRAGNR